MNNFKRSLELILLPIKKKYGFKVKPRFLNFLVTYRCNSRCTMCGIWKKYQGADKNLVEKELTTKEILDFFKTNKDFLNDLTHMGLTGGEPLLRPDLVKIIKGVRQILPQTQIGFQTNGLLPEKVKITLRQIKTFYPEIAMAVSIDGLEKIHDQTRGVQGSFKKSLETIKIAQKFGVKRITSGMTINALNISEVNKVKEMLESWGVEFTCFLPDKAEYFNNQQQTFDFSPNLLKKVTGILQKNFSYHYFSDNLRLQLLGKRKRKLPCYSGYSSIVLDPYGNIKPCILTNNIFGNIREEKNLEKLLYSKKAKTLKKKLRNCRCWNQCEVSSSAVVFPWDVFWWFLFYCQDKRKFLQKTFNRLATTRSV